MTGFSLCFLCVLCASALNTLPPFQRRGAENTEKAQRSKGAS
jgi:hypothetical protein